MYDVRYISRWRIPLRKVVNCLPEFLSGAFEVCKEVDIVFAFGEFNECSCAVSISVILFGGDESLSIVFVHLVFLFD